MFSRCTYIYHFLREDFSDVSGENNLISLYKQNKDPLVSFSPTHPPNQHQHTFINYWKVEKENIKQSAKGKT